MDELMAPAKAADLPSREGMASAPTVHHQRVFVRTRNDDMPPTGAVYVLDLDSGAVLFRGASTYGGSPAGDDETVYFMAVTEKHARLHAIELSTGKPLWVVDLSAKHVKEQARPMLSKNFIYAEKLKIDRKTGAIEGAVPIDLGSPHQFESPSEAGEPICFPIFPAAPKPQPARHLSE